jgi:hypothetical protein
MKKSVFTLCFIALVSVIIAQQTTLYPSVGNPIVPSREVLAACLSEKGTFDFPFTDNGITVTGTGTGSFQDYAPGFTSCNISCKPNCVWIGYGGPGTYTNTFSQPVNNMLYNLTGTDEGEVITITADAGTLTITYTDGTCPEDFSITGNVITCIGEPETNAAGGRFLVTSTSNFTSVTFSHPGTLNGTVITMCFDQVIESVPVSNWALFIGIGLILVFAVVRFRKMV